MSGSFGRLVSDAMARKGLGLRELCRGADVDPSFLSKVLAGKRNPPSEEDVLRRLAAALGLDPLALVVSAGRIPSDWGDLAANPDLLRRLSSMIPGALVSKAPPPPAPVSRVETDKWRTRTSSIPHVRKPFSEELL